MDAHHLAQVNIAIPLAPLTDARLAGFVAALEPVNALADAAPGFVWRLQTEDGDATSIRAFDDDRILVNMSVWTSLEALGEFVYRGAHVVVMRRRREWFAQMREAITALWWIPAGQTPSLADARERLSRLHEHGPTPHAFTFRQPFPAPGATPARPDHAWLCPA